MTGPDAAADDRSGPDDRNLSTERLDPLREVFGRDLPGLIDHFLEDLSFGPLALTEALEHGDTNTVWEIAHKLGGSSGMFGALHLEAAFRLLEEAAEVGTNDLALLIAEVEARAIAIRPALQALASGGEPPAARPPS